jgi:hypothetical protein
MKATDGSVRVPAPALAKAPPVQADAPKASLSSPLALGVVPIPLQRPPGAPLAPMHGEPRANGGRSALVDTQALQTEGGRAHKGVRTGDLNRRMADPEALREASRSRSHRAAFNTLLELGSGELLSQAEASPTAEALRLANEAVTAGLLEALRAAELPKPEHTVAVLKKAGLDVLLTRTLGKGRLTHGMVNAQIDSMRGQLAGRKLSATELRDGILAFDELALRLGFIAGRQGKFEYPATQNRGRDLLITFARSLHR